MSTLPDPLRKVMYFVLLATGMTLLFYVTFYNVNRRWEPLPLRPPPLVMRACDSTAPLPVNAVWSSIWMPPACGGETSDEGFLPPYWVHYRGPNTAEAVRTLDVRIKQGMDEAYELTPPPDADLLDVSLFSARLTLNAGQWVPFFDDSAGRSWVIWNPAAPPRLPAHFLKGPGNGFRIWVDSALVIYFIADTAPMTAARAAEWARRVPALKVDSAVGATAAFPAMKALGRWIRTEGHTYHSHQAVVELTTYYAPFAYRRLVRRIREHYPIRWYGEGTLVILTDASASWWTALYLRKIDRWHP